MKITPKISTPKNTPQTEPDGNITIYGHDQLTEYYRFAWVPELGNVSKKI